MDREILYRVIQAANPREQAIIELIKLIPIKDEFANKYKDKLLEVTTPKTTDTTTEKKVL